MSIQGDTINAYWALQVAYDNKRLKPSARVIAYDLLSKFVGKGSWEELAPLATPTYKQVQLAEKLVAEGEAYMLSQTTATPQIDTVQITGNPMQALQALFGNTKLKKPVIKLTMKDGYSIEISKAGAKSINPGYLYLKWGIADPIWYIGKISPGGAYSPKNYDTSKQPYEALKQCNYPDVIELVSAFAADPLKVAAESGSLSGRCCFCNKKLDTYESTSLGYGPTCAKTWGLKHTKAAATAAQTAAVEAAKAKYPDYAKDTFDITTEVHSKQIIDLKEGGAAASPFDQAGYPVSQTVYIPVEEANNLLSGGQDWALIKAIADIRKVANVGLAVARSIAKDIRAEDYDAAMIGLTEGALMPKHHAWTLIKHVRIKHFGPEKAPEEPPNVMLAHYAQQDTDITLDLHNAVQAQADIAANEEALAQAEYDQVKGGPHAPLMAFVHKDAATAYKLKMGYTAPLTQHSGKWIVTANKPAHTPIPNSYAAEYKAMAHLLNETQASYSTCENILAEIKQGHTYEAQSLLQGQTKLGWKDSAALVAKVQGVLGIDTLTPAQYTAKLVASGKAKIEAIKHVRFVAQCPLVVAKDFVLGIAAKKDFEACKALSKVAGIPFEKATQLMHDVRSVFKSGEDAAKLAAEGKGAYSDQHQGGSS